MKNKEVDGIFIQCSDYTEMDKVKVTIANGWGASYTEEYDPYELDLEGLKEVVEFLRKRFEKDRIFIEYEGICLSDLDGIYPSEEFCKAKEAIGCEFTEYNGSSFFENVMGDFPTRHDFFRDICIAFYNLMYEDSETEGFEETRVIACKAENKWKAFVDLAEGREYLVVEGATEDVIYFIEKSLLTEAEYERIKSYKGTMEVRR